MKKPPTLLFCIIMDLLGCATYILPGLGEFADIIWAPISAIIFYKTFGGWKGAFGSIFNFYRRNFARHRYHPFLHNYVVFKILQSKICLFCNVLRVLFLNKYSS